MDMNLNAELVRSERLKRAWSQEQLAHVSGLGVRTIQRIETTGSASLETVKALAAVLELPLSDLLIEAPTTTPRPFWRRPLNIAATALTAIVVFVVAGMLAPMVLARQVDIDMAVQLDNQQISRSRMGGEEGSTDVMQIDKLLKIALTPTISKNGAVFIHADIYAYENDEFKLVAKPSVMIDNARTSEIRVTTNSGSLLQLKLTPQIR